MIVKRGCKLYSQPISYKKVGKRNHNCYKATCGTRPPSTPSPPAPAPTPAPTPAPINIDCSVQVSCIWDDWDATTNEKAPLFPGTQAQCDEYVAGLNALAGLSGVEKVQCVARASQNQGKSPSTVDPSSFAVEQQPLPGFAFHIPGGAAGALATDAGYGTDTANCEAAATKINAAMAFTSTTFSNSGITPVVSVSCQSSFGYVRLLSPLTATASSSIDPEFACNAAWRQVNFKVFDEYCICICCLA